MKQSTTVLTDPQACAAAVKALAAQRKVLGERELFFGNGLIMCDSVPKYTNDKHTVVRRAKGAPAPAPRIPDGSDFEAYYLSFNEATDDQKDAAANAVVNGVDPRLVKGKFCDVSFASEGHAIMMVTNAYRTTVDGTPSYRVLSLKTGIIIAMTFNRGLGDTKKFKADAEKYLELRNCKAIADADPGLNLVPDSPGSVGLTTVEEDPSDSKDPIDPIDIPEDVKPVQSEYSVEPPLTMLVDPIEVDDDLDFPGPASTDIKGPEDK